MISHRDVLRIIEAGGGLAGFSGSQVRDLEICIDTGGEMSGFDGPLVLIVEDCPQARDLEIWKELLRTAGQPAPEAMGAERSEEDANLRYLLIRQCSLDEMDMPSETLPDLTVEWIRSLPLTPGDFVRRMALFELLRRDLHRALIEYDIRRSAETQPAETQPKDKAKAKTNQDSIDILEGQSGRLLETINDFLADDNAWLRTILGRGTGDPSLLLHEARRAVQLLHEAAAAAADVPPSAPLKIKPTALRVLVGRDLPAIYERHFSRRFGVGKNPITGTVDSPGLRFAAAVLDVIGAPRSAAAVEKLWDRYRAWDNGRK